MVSSYYIMYQTDMNTDNHITNLDVEHLLVHLLHGHPASEHGGHGEVAAVPGVAGRHHVLGVEHLLGQLGNCQSSTTFHILFGHHGDFHHHWSTFVFVLIFFRALLGIHILLHQN